MFFRKKGRGFQLIYSYRDGQSRVRQLRVATLLSREEALERLEPGNWETWLREVSKQVPQQRQPGIEDSKLRERLLALVSEEPASDGGMARGAGVTRKARVDCNSWIWRQVASLRRQLEQVGDRDVWLSVLQSLQPPSEVAATTENGRLAELKDEVRSSPRLQLLRHDRTSPETQAHVRRLEELAKELERQGRWSEAVRWRTEQVNLSLDVNARAHLALALQMSKRVPEAELQYRLLPGTSALCHYGLGALAFQRGCREEAFDHAVKALFRDRWLAASEAFWAGVGQGWGGDGRVFVWAISQQFPIRWEIRLREERARGPGGPLPSLAPLERSGILRKLGVAHKVPKSNRETSSPTRWRWEAKHGVFERAMTKGDVRESIDEEIACSAVSSGAVGL